MEKQSAALSPEDRLTLSEADLAGAWEEMFQLRASTISLAAPVSVT